MCSPEKKSSHGKASTLPGPASFPRGQMCPAPPPLGGQAGSPASTLGQVEVKASRWGPCHAPGHVAMLEMAPLSLGAGGC